VISHDLAASRRAPAVSSGAVSDLACHPPNDHPAVITMQDAAPQPGNSKTRIFLEMLTIMELRLTFLVMRSLRRRKIMELTKITGTNCKDGDCPAVYRTDRGTVAVQGYRVPHAAPEDEAIVEIPAELLVEAMRALGG
jgi:hypothetical protein